MTRLPAVPPKKLIRALLRAGTTVERVKGSHHHLRHPGNPQVMVTVPLHAGDIKPKVIHSIIAQTGMSLEEFLKLL